MEAYPLIRFEVIFSEIFDIFCTVIVNIQLSPNHSGKIISILYPDPLHLFIRNAIGLSIK